MKVIALNGSLALCDVSIPKMVMMPSLNARVSMNL